MEEKSALLQLAVSQFVSQCCWVYPNFNLPPCQNRYCPNHVASMDLHIRKWHETEKSTSIDNCIRFIDSSWTLQEIADVWGMSRERVRQIEEKALHRLTKNEGLKRIAKDHGLKFIGEVIGGMK